MSAPARAAIDIGTNSTNLLIVDGDGHRERWVTVTRLGKDVDQRRRSIRRRSSAPWPPCASTALGSTSATSPTSGSRLRPARDAEDRDAVLARFAEVLDTAPELLSGEEEGRLAFRGATSDLHRELAPFLVVDIGGGSTELVLGTDDPQATVSMDVGGVRLTEAELHGDPPAPDELANALAVAQAHLEDALLAVPALAEASTVVGIAGTITTVAAVEIGLPTYDPELIHGFQLQREAVEDVFRTLATEPLAARVHNPGLPPERADVIVGGCCMLVTILRRLQLPAIRVSDHNLLDGLLEESST